MKPPHYLQVIFWIVSFLVMGVSGTAYVHTNFATSKRVDGLQETIERIENKTDKVLLFLSERRR